MPFKDDRLEDYHYQTATDPPKNVPHKKCKDREEVWKAIIDGNMNNSLTLNIINLHNFWEHAPWNKLKTLLDMAAQHLNQKNQSKFINMQKCCFCLPAPIK